ncbi:MAG: hypothetical protein AAGJ79_14975 [Verrucomicrobiota bacterium]
MGKSAVIKIYMVFWVLTTPLNILIFLAGIPFLVLSIFGFIFGSQVIEKPLVALITGSTMLLWSASSLLIGVAIYDLVIEKSQPEARSWLLVGVCGGVCAAIIGILVALNIATDFLGLFENFDWKTVPLISSYHVLIPVLGIVLWATIGRAPETTDGQ